MVSTFGVSATQSPFVPTATSAGVVASLVQGGSTATPATARPVTPVAPAFFNPRFSFDRELGLLIMQVRDDATGEVLTQFPSEKVVKEYRRQQSNASGDSQAPANDEESAAPAAVEEQPRPARIEIQA